MGDSEFVGGGSVTWEINHSDGESGGGDKVKCKGKDKNPKGPNGKFVVLVTGHAPIIVPTEGTTVRVIWGDESVAPTATTQATKAKRKK